MNKSDRLLYLIRRGEELKEKDNLVFGGLPPTREDIAEEVLPLESFLEHKKDEISANEALTSDEL